MDRKGPTPVPVDISHRFSASGISESTTNPAARAPVVADVADVERGYGPQRAAPVLVTGGGNRHAVRRWVEKLQPFAFAGARARRDRVLARPHAAEPQPGKNGKCSEHPCFRHWYVTARPVVKIQDQYGTCRP